MTRAAGKSDVLTRLRRSRVAWLAVASGVLVWIWSNGNGGSKPGLGPGLAAGTGSASGPASDAPGGDADLHRRMWHFAEAARVWVPSAGDRSGRDLFSPPRPPKVEVPSEVQRPAVPPPQAASPDRDEGGLFWQHLGQRMLRQVEREKHHDALVGGLLRDAGLLRVNAIVFGDNTTERRAMIGNHWLREGDTVDAAGGPLRIESIGRRHVILGRHGYQAGLGVGPRQAPELVGPS